MKKGYCYELEKKHGGYIANIFIYSDDGGYFTHEKFLFYSKKEIIQKLRSKKIVVPKDVEKGSSKFDW